MTEPLDLEANEGDGRRHVQRGSPLPITPQMLRIAQNPSCAWRGAWTTHAGELALEGQRSRREKMQAWRERLEAAEAADKEALPGRPLTLRERAAVRRREGR